MVQKSECLFSNTCHDFGVSENYRWVTIKKNFPMRDTDVIPFVSYSGTLIYIRKFQFQKIRDGQIFDFISRF